MENGDYVPDEKGGFVSVTGGEALLQRVLLKLKARRGFFPFLPDFGSKLYLLPRSKQGDREALARQYVAEALADEAELEVTGVSLAEDTDGRSTLTVALSWQGESLYTEVEL